MYVGDSLEMAEPRQPVVGLVKVLDRIGRPVTQTTFLGGTVYWHVGDLQKRRMYRMQRRLITQHVLMHWRAWSRSRRSGTQGGHISTRPNHSNPVKKRISSLPRYSNVGGAEVAPIINKIRPDDGVWRDRLHKRLMRCPAVQGFLYQSGQITESHIPFSTFLAESIAGGSNIVIVQVQGTQLAI